MGWLQDILFGEPSEEEKKKTADKIKELEEKKAKEGLMWHEADYLNDLKKSGGRYIERSPCDKDIDDGRRGPTEEDKKLQDKLYQDLKDIDERRKKREIGFWEASALKEKVRKSLRDLDKEVAFRLWRGLLMDTLSRRVRFFERLAHRFLLRKRHFGRRCRMLIFQITLALLFQGFSMR